VRRCRGRLAPWSSRARWASSQGQEVQKRYGKCAKINEPAKSGENALCSVSWMRVKAGEKVMADIPWWQLPWPHRPASSLPWGWSHTARSYESSPLAKSDSPWR
jgi:hypothetical protein